MLFLFDYGDIILVTFIFLGGSALPRKKHTHVATELDSKIIAIQKSTRTIFPQFVPVHNQLRKIFRWYYLWHIFPSTQAIHWATLALYTFIIASIISSTLLTKVPTVEAISTSRTWTTQSDFGILPSDQNVQTYESSGNVALLRNVVASGIDVNTIFNRGAIDTVEFQGELYATAVSGKVYKYNGTTWTLAFNTNIYYSVLALAVFNNVLYVGTTGELYKYDGVNLSVSIIGSGEVPELAVFENKLY